MNALHKTDENGYALILAMVFMFGAVLLVIPLGTRIHSHLQQVEQFSQFENTLQGLEFAIAESLADLKAGGRGRIGLDAWSPPGAAALPAFDEEGVAPRLVPFMAGIEYFAYAQNWASDGLDNNGDGVIDDADEQGLYVLHAYARTGPVVRKVEVVLRSASEEGGSRRITQISWRELGRPWSQPN